MAVIPVTITDNNPEVQRWEMPANYDGLRSPIPRGILTYSLPAGTAVAALDAANQTFISLAMNFPTGFTFLPRSLSFMFISDDLTNDFNNNAFGFYSGFLGDFNITSPGEVIAGATVARRIWTIAPGTAKLFIPGGAQVGAQFVDMSADASTAGDFFYFCKFYIFDVDQITKWELNTPIPTIPHSSF